ncbi:hypothetical protein BMETH_21751121430, partial [methanotrophic bacterial endosymbiont of Bathymodiolus sp.]
YKQAEQYANQALKINPKDSGFNYFRNYGFLRDSNIVPLW